MNKKSVKRILWILLFLAFPLNLTATPVLPVGKAEYDFVYERLVRSDILSYEVYDYQLGPYDNNHGQFSFGPFDYLSSLDPNSLSIFSFVGENFRSAKNQSPAGFESLRGGVAASPVKGMFVYGNFVLDEQKAEDDNYTGKKWRGLAGGVEEAFIHYRLKPLRITLGRFASFWGPRNSLVLSPNNALDGLGYSFHWGRLVLSYRLAKLDGLNPDEDDVEQFENRFFAGHRLDIHFAKWLRMGFFETIIFGGPGRQVDLFYLNPIVFFHADQLNEGMDDNTLVGFDFVVKPRTGLRLYGQLLIDDFQIDKETQGDQETDQYGVLFGADLAEVMPSVDLNIEYSRVTNWTFNQALDRNRYLFNGDLIGGALGNDYEHLNMSFKRWFGDNTAVSTNLVYQRRGEGRVTAEWTAPWFDTEGDYSEPFPTGTVETTKSASLRFSSFLLEHFYIDTEAGISRVDNYLNIEGDNRDLPFMRLQVSTFFSTPVSIDW